MGLRTLMGGTLTGFIAFGQSCVVGRGEYIDTLLGPERTRECAFKAKQTIRSDLRDTAGLRVE